MAIKKTLAATETCTNEELGNVSKTKKDVMINKYIKNISIMSKSTAREYLTRLSNFQTFIHNEYAILSTDDFINKIKKGVLDVYDILNGYSAYLQQNHTISTLTLKQRIITVKNFFEYYDVDVKVTNALFP